MGKGNKKSGKLLWKIHSWVGLYVGIVIAILSITGAAAVFIPEIDNMLENQYHKTSGTEGSLVPVSALLTELREKYPNHTLLNIAPPEKTGGVLVFDFFTRGESPSLRIKVFVDPYTGEITGEKNHTDGLANYLRQLHVRLLDSWYGRQIVGLAGIGLLIISITGLLIHGSFMKKQLFGSIRNGRGLRILMADVHKLTGIAALLFNLVIAITGAWLGLQPKLMNWFSIEAPNKYQVAEKPITKEEDLPFDFDYYQIVSRSKKTLAGFVPTMVIPSEDGSRSVEVRGNIPGLVYEQHISKVIIDKLSNEVLFKYDLREQSFWHKLYFMQEGLHFGRFAGLGVKILYFILGLTSGLLSITGFIIYLKRSENKSVERSTVLKTVYIYSVAIFATITALGFISLVIGYAYAAAIVTPSVYIFLTGFVAYSLIRSIRKSKKSKQGKKEKKEALQEA